MDEELDEDEELGIEDSLLIDELDIEGTLSLLEKGSLLELGFAFVFEVATPMVTPAPIPTANEATIEMIIGSFFILSSPYKTNKIRSTK